MPQRPRHRQGLSGHILKLNLLLLISDFPQFFDLILIPLNHRAFQLVEELGLVLFNFFFFLNNYNSKLFTQHIFPSGLYVA